MAWNPEWLVALSEVAAGRTPYLAQWNAKRATTELATLKRQFAELVDERGLPPTTCERRALEAWRRYEHDGNGSAPDYVNGWRDAIRYVLDNSS